MLPIHRILHPTDFSESCGPAFHLACALARDYSAELTVLHVASQAPIIAPNGEAMVWPEDELDRARERLEQVHAKDPLVSMKHQLAEGNPADEILRVARENKADLIVMGTHGWTGLYRLLMGSVAEEVMRKACCPVVTIRPQALVEQPADQTSQQAAIA